MVKPTHLYLKLLVLLATVFVGSNCNEIKADPRWKTCGLVPFCTHLRATKEGSSKLVLNMDLKTKNGTITSTLQEGTKKLDFTLIFLESSTFHLLIDEKNSKRYKEAHVVTQPKELSKVEMKKNDTTATITSGSLKAIVRGNPFQIEFYKDQKLISIVNGKNRLAFGTGATDKAIAVDISFPGAQRAYGLPEHADSLALQNTDNREPYRHFNVDYGNYHLRSTEALYGAIGVLYAHAVTHSSGVFWFNPSQTWVDVKTSPQNIDTYFMSETGALEVYILAGPTLSDAVKQYAKLTGHAPLPQYFSLGYHQSRYSYMTQKEVMEVSDEFDKINLPLDVLWLDIDYTDEKKYFTWHKTNYEKPLELQENLMKKHRTLVAIIDPHIKTNIKSPDEYFLDQEAKNKGFYVKNPDKTDFVGECWPGESSWLDFFKSAAFEYYANLYNDTKYHFEGQNIHVWNDMNEPAIFEDPANENTMPLTLKHNDGKIEHREVHNVYGFHQVRATHKGMSKSKVKGRPFILTRSHFAGIQKYAAIWTGDNYANWDHLQISFPMCLTEALAGVSFCGADVGGFGGIPSDELYQRWYQAGAWLPFYRGHSATDVPRREPYYYPPSVQERVKTAINQRYAHIPAWYTAFREHELTGEPVIRPIIYQYPHDGDALSIDDQVLIGTDILAAPVLKEGALFRKVYLPGGDEQNWYNIDEHYKMYNGTGEHVIPVTINSVPVFYRGGSIISRKDTPRQTTAETINDPYTIYICLNHDMTAKGNLYEDDHKSFDYKNTKKPQHIYISMEFANNTIFSKVSESVYGNGKITKIVILNPPANITGATVDDNKQAVTTEYAHKNTTLTITKIDLSITKEFKVLLTTKSFGTVLGFNSLLLIFAIIKATFM